MSDVRVVLVTCPTGELAAELARSVVSAGLAACANILPGVRSMYRWEGEVHDETEVLMIIKTTAPLLVSLEEAILAAHPYDTAEFIALQPEHVAPRYAAWVCGGG